MRIRLACICLSCLGTLLPLVAQTGTTVQVPRLIRLSGTLSPSPGASAGSSVAGVTFSLYKDETGGSPLWTETQNVEVDSAGHYTVLLGSTLAAGLPIELFTSGDAQWLGVARQGEPEQPRIMLVSVPFALKAGDAETLGGKPASAYAQAPVPGSSSAATATPTSLANGATAGTKGLARTPDVSGGGKAGYIPLWATPTGLATSSIFDDKKGYIGIGTDQPKEPLTVVGNDDFTIYSLANASNGVAVSGTNSSDTGGGGGVLGFVVSGDAIAVAGANFGDGGDAVGVLGTSTGIDGTAIKGINPYPKDDGRPTGVAGGVANAGGVGGFFINGAAKGQSLAVFGRSDAIGGTAVLGVADDAKAPPGDAPTVASLIRRFAAAQPAARKWAPNRDLKELLRPHPSEYDTPDANVGVAGESYAPKGNTIGVFGEDASPNGAGGAFVNLAATGDAFGIGAYSLSTTGVGVRGGLANPSTTGGQVTTRPLGLWGDTVNGGAAVLGTADNAPAVMGVNNSATQAAGVFTNNNSNGTGVAGTSSTTTGYAVGVFGSSATGPGGSFLNSTNSGITAGMTGASASPYGFGVYGVAGAPKGVFQLSGANNVGSSDGVAGFNLQTSGYANGVYGATSSPDGVAAYFDNYAGGYILVGAVNGKPAHMFHVDGEGDGYFAGDLEVGGDLTVDGTISKSGGSFKIDDPIDPEHKTLSHSFVESPDMMNIYDGSARLDAHGEAWVSMPNYFEALNRDFQYVLTSVGSSQPRLYIAQEIKGNRFKIAGGRPNGKVSWMVTGIRQDAWANAHRIPTEEEKPAKQRGTYLHPDLYDENAARSTNAMLQHSPAP